ncbi:hypothetical protein HPP92_009254 [Vanilla planifolia]|uniref:Uncharacterized protein n=1 Tax=Vanilla planifolia TaxID=51239 RepID=A0A835RC14_VANPL|nr:hypothetical protein HPP92_009254 [Vanilla planifolia]
MGWHKVKQTHAVAIGPGGAECEYASFGRLCTCEGGDGIGHVGAFEISIRVGMEEKATSRLVVDIRPRIAGWDLGFFGTLGPAALPLRLAVDAVEAVLLLPVVAHFGEKTEAECGKRDMFDERLRNAPVHVYIGARILLISTLALIFSFRLKICRNPIR